MKKRNKAKDLEPMKLNNPVAKYAARFNKAAVFKDKRQYQRKAKHVKCEPFSISFVSVIEKGLYNLCF